MLSCKDVTHLISERQERVLGFRERVGLRFHLWICVSCRRFERQLALLQLALRKLSRRAAEQDDDGKALPPEARERIRKALAEHCDHSH